MVAGFVTMRPPMGAMIDAVLEADAERADVGLRGAGLGLGGLHGLPQRRLARDEVVEVRACPTAPLATSAFSRSTCCVSSARLARAVATRALRDADARRGGDDLALLVGVLELGEDVALLDGVALLDEHLGEPAGELGADLGGALRDDVARGRDCTSACDGEMRAISVVFTSCLRISPSSLVHPNQPAPASAATTASGTSARFRPDAPGGRGEEPFESPSSRSMRREARSELSWSDTGLRPA